MKALTVCQPYAHLIALGIKRVENRTWATNFRGRLAIHAGKSRAWLLHGDQDRWPDMAFGAVIATADLTNCVSIDRVRRLDPAYSWVAAHEHTEGPFCWVLENVTPLSAVVPCRGQPGLFDLPDDVLRLVNKYDIENALL